MIQPDRIKKLNYQSKKDKKYVVYWMQQSQRTEYNHALEHAIIMANKYKKPLIVFFGITDNYTDANLRHYHFMIEGLKQVDDELKKRNIALIVQNISPDKGIIELSKRADLIVVDRGYLKIQKQWRKNAAKNIKCPIIQVETDVIVPVETASNKEEYTAATFRPKIKKHLPNFLKPMRKTQIEKDISNNDFQHINLDSVINDLKIDRSVRPVRFKACFKHAKKQLKDFIENKLEDFPELRNDPADNYLSNLSPYLHFGQISTLYIALEINKQKTSSKENFLEELIVRRELSMNFCNYNKEYDNIKCLPNWAYQTIMNHKKDKREYNYSLDILENAETHDDYWNAAQIQMLKTGKMHGYMRMYWGKKIIEWSKNPEDAYNNAVFLNNKYELDGRDPNGYTGVAWCFGKHDRPWVRRNIFGKIRYMSAKGLERKFDIEKYVKMVKK